MNYIRKKNSVVYMTDIYDLPDVDSGYGFSIGGYGGDLKDNIINYDTMLTYLYDNNTDAYHKSFLNRPLILRVTDKYMPSFEILYTDDEIKDFKYRHKNKSIREYGLYYISDDGVEWYRCLAYEDFREMHKVRSNK